MTSTQKGVVVCLSRRHLKLKSVQIYCFLKSDTPDTAEIYMLWSLEIWSYGAMARKRNYTPNVDTLIRFSFVCFSTPT